jgi:hypothetical protein
VFELITSFWLHLGNNYHFIKSFGFHDINDRFVVIVFAFRLTTDWLSALCLHSGDGTNDVGALKHAHVGVALLANAPLQASDLPKPKKPSADTSVAANHEMSSNIPRNRMRGRSDRSSGAANGPQNSRPNRAAETQQQLQRMLEEMDEQEKASVVKLGDASIAAPFTSKLSSIQCGSPSLSLTTCALMTNQCLCVCHLGNSMSYHQTGQMYTRHDTPDV